jgi:hypothetical protein
VSDYNGTTGGVIIKKTDQSSDGNGTGGVKITSVQNVTTYQYDGLTVTSVNGASVPGIQVTIEITPPRQPPVQFRPINDGFIPVAILTTPAFDATTVNPTTVRFGPKAATNGLSPAVQDVDGDGKPDLVLYFKGNQTGIGCKDTKAVLTGLTTAGQSFAGQEALRPGC